MTEKPRTMPRRKKRLVRSIFLTAALTVLAGVFIFASVKFIQETSEYRKGQDIYDHIRESFMAGTVPATRGTKASKTDHPAVRPSLVPGETNGPENADGTPYYPDYSAYEHEQPLKLLHTTFDYVLMPLYTYDLTALIEMNPEVVGWIEIAGTHIDYPVVKAKDNVKYLRTAVNGEENNAGSIFVDSRVDLPFIARNTIIYGHNQRNSRMFHDLLSYEKEDFIREHAFVKIITADGKVRLYRIYSAYYTSDTAVYKFTFSSTELYQAYLNQTVSRSIYNFGMVPNTSQRILTLSTCTNEYDDRRFIVHAVLVSEQ